MLVLVLLLTGCFVTAQDVFGKWKAVNHTTGNAKSVVEIYQVNDVVYGKVVEIFDPKERDLLCVECTGENYNKPILDLVIIKDMVKDGKYYKHGKVVDPQTGKIYKLKLGITDDDKLFVRGYIGFFYTTQYWEKAD